MCWGCQPYARASFTPRKYSWFSLLLEAESTLGPQCGQKDDVNGKYQSHHRRLNPRPFGLYCIASTKRANPWDRRSICDVHREQWKNNSWTCTHIICIILFFCTSVQNGVPWYVLVIYVIYNLFNESGSVPCTLFAQLAILKCTMLSTPWYLDVSNLYTVFV